MASGALGGNCLHMGPSLQGGGQEDSLPSEEHLALGGVSPRAPLVSSDAPLLLLPVVSEVSYQGLEMPLT